MPASKVARRSRSKGDFGETLALRYLEARGLRLLCRNYRCRLGEIDLVMREGKTLVFVEVRLRNSSRFGSALESIDARKRRKLLLAAQHYLARFPYEGPVRFDVVALQADGEGYHVLWLRNALD